VAWVKQHSWVLLPIIAIPAFWPFFSTGLIAGSDTEAAVIRLAMLDHQVQRGVFYPRIVPEFATGLGYPLYSFYSLVSFYLGEMFHLLGLDYANALIAAAMALMLIGSFGVYLLARDLFGREQGWAALLAAVVYIYSPYLLLNVYVRGGFPEVGGQAMLPWAIWSVRRLVTADRPGTYVLIAALSLAALAVSHILTLFLAVPFLAGYAVVVWWQSGHDARRLAWIAAGVAAGAGLSAFFWLPLIVERAYLSDTPYRVASQWFLPENVWRWNNFLDRHFFFRYVPNIPFKLGIVQLALAVAGILLARRRDAEWLYLIFATVVAGLSIGAWALPIWLSSPILVSIEFTWRQLVIISVPLALFTGAIVLRVRRPGWQLALSAAVALLVIVAHRPQLPNPTALTLEDPAISLPWIAQFEGRTGALGIGYLQGLLPRWTTGNQYCPTEAPGEAAVTVERANSLGLEGRVSSPNGGALRFAAFYFPGWQVYLDGQQEPTYPTTNMGLLTIDIPAGNHDLKLIWGGTTIHSWANLLSVLTLLGLIVVTWRYGQRRWMALVPGVLLVAALFLIFWRPPLVEMQAPAQAVASDQLTLLGYRTERVDERSLYVYPYWYVSETPSESLLVRWHLRDSTGRSVSSEWSRPFFDSQAASNWPPGTLVDDAYLLTLPTDWPDDTYELTAEFRAEPATDQPSYHPENSTDVRFGDGMLMQGYDLEINQLSVLASNDLLVAHPGDALDITIGWQAMQLIEERLGGFVHLVDTKGTPLLQADHWIDFPGPSTWVWCPSVQQVDRYQLRIPENAPAGVYWPVVGLYGRDAVDRLPVQNEHGESSGDAYRLPPVKILDVNHEIQPQHEVFAAIDDFAVLKGYDLELPEEGLRPGSQFVLTLYFDVQTESPQDLTRFVHLIDPVFGMAAQVDSQPDDGKNPTWSWISGETVVDPVRLTIAADARPGVYSLRVGLYDPATGVRVPLRDSAGVPLPDDQVILTELRVEK
jgi:hypothetical protein